MAAKKQRQDEEEVQEPARVGLSINMGTDTIVALNQRAKKNNKVRSRLAERYIRQGLGLPVEG